MGCETRIPKHDFRQNCKTVVNILSWKRQKKIQRYIEKFIFWLRWDYIAKETYTEIGICNITILKSI